MKYKNSHITQLLCLCICFTFQITAQTNYGRINDEAYVNLSIQPVHNLNTEQLEFSPISYQEGFLYWTSSANNKKYDPEIKKSLFEMRFFGIEHVEDSLQIFIQKLNDLDVHKGPGSFANMHSEFYYTLEKRAESFEKKSTLTVQKAIKDNGQWKIAETPFEMLDQYSYCHPAIDPGNEIMIIASDMPGGYGGMDLYMLKFSEGRWSEMLNLGPEINSIGNEVFPYLFEKNVLFYASDKDGGYGGLDMYSANLATRNSQILPRTPLNSASDDFGLLLNPDSYSGYFSSTRITDEEDNIFEFSLSSPLLTGKPKKQIEDPLISIWVRDEVSGATLEGVNLYLQSLDFDCEESKLSGFHIKSLEIDKLSGEHILRLKSTENSEAEFLDKTDDSGFARLKQSILTRGVLMFQKETYEIKELVFTKDSIQEKVVVFMSPEPELQLNTSEENQVVEAILEIFSAPTKMINEKRGEIVKLKQLEFKANSSEIVENSTGELELLASQMIHNPDLIIELSSHTDSRGDNKSNQILSQARAERAKGYLVTLGIEADRIEAMGFGERFILNRCVKGIRCTDQEHLLNRRVEIRVLDY